MRLAHSQHLFHHRPVVERSPAQIGPIPAFAASDHVVNRGQGKLLVDEMPV